MSTADPPVRRYGRTEVLVAGAIVAAAHFAAWAALQLPVPRPGGSELATVAVVYVWVAALVALAIAAFGVTPVRAFLTAYIAMGVAAVATLAYVTYVVFPDGYVKDFSRLWRSVAFLFAANVVTGYVGLAVGARLGPGGALLGTALAMIGAPAAALLVLPCVVIVQAVWVMLSRFAT